MGIWDSTIYSVVCDEDGCYEEAPQEDSKHSARKSATEEGWAEVAGKWYCPDHVAKAQRREKQAKQKGGK
jgi:hypothetical protein